MKGVLNKFTTGGYILIDSTTRRDATQAYWTILIRGE
jgi:hypothetical protein